ncbi:hypothetical protein [Cohnella sp. 56]|uniref:hypothetical protein n=1 Tax=Cohnella sp. 56 TaxID=3113722 RepID=UPI0030E8A242
MLRKIEQLNPEHHVQLAYMECLTSCILTYLKSTGREYDKLLLDYWNIGYEHRTLLSSKSAEHLLLQYLYGIHLRHEQGSEEGLQAAVQAGRSAVCLCMASKLPYFPRDYLNMESSGFWHAILVQGWDADKGVYLVADPVVRKVAELRPQEIAYACALRTDRAEMQFFDIFEPELPHAEPGLGDVLLHCATRNAAAYRSPGERLVQQSGEATGRNKREAVRLWFLMRNSGVKAWERFESDVNESLAWTAVMRARWIKQNTVTVFSIKQLRYRIWALYQELAAMDEPLAGRGQTLFDQVSAAWNAFNMALVRYGNTRDQAAGMVASVVRQAGVVRDAEVRFLSWLHTAVTAGGRDAESIV